MKQPKLAETLEKDKVTLECQSLLKSNLKSKSESVFEGIANEGNVTLLNQIYTEVHMTEGGSGEVNTDHEVRQIEKASKKPVRPETPIGVNDIFKAPPGRVKPARTVLTKGVAGIGKTLATQKFTLDWAEGKANQNIQFTFPIPFRELNLLEQQKYSMMELLQKFFYETKECKITNFDKCQVAMIFDGLDECRLPLDFENNETWTDVTKPTSVDVLLTNLIKGNLLHSVQLWITTRPVAANKIPPEWVGLVTEVRGFNDPQKEEYFMKRFSDKKLAIRIFSHVKTSRSLHIMCHIPVFCLITAKVLEHMLTADQRGELPKTLTEMYIHFLVFQSIRGNAKNCERPVTDSQLDERSKKTILSLGKLAFQQLVKGNLIFYESDVEECGIDVKAASPHLAVFTDIFREERGLYQNRVFCFVHLSFQEFLAALYVFLSFFNSRNNLLSGTETKWSQSKLFKPKPAPSFYRCAVDKALQRKDGHWDLFLRFLLGLSTNQTLLRGLLKQTGSSSKTNETTAEYIKEKIQQNLSSERKITLFHCLNELNDHSLVTEIKQYLESGSLSSKELSPAQWSALAFFLLTSAEELDVFDLKKYSASEEGLLGLLPVVKASTTALLSVCSVTALGCASLASALSSNPSHLRELDLSHNDLGDSGVELLSAELNRTNCKLETLRLSGCLVTEQGCSSLASALRSDPSHLRELDLSYNHPGDSGAKLLSALQEDPHLKLKTLKVDDGGEFLIKTGPRKCEY
ncbi:protein NLRC3-like [Aplochiton taeniatus]